jgi:8-oxo-dGTP diphosphatase
MTRDSQRRKVFDLAVDLIVFTIRDDSLNVLLVKRGEEPYKGRWALPGGHVELDEDLPHAAVRELAEETGIEGAVPHLEQVATYGALDRDPRNRVVSVAYLAIMPRQPPPTAGTDAAHAEWKPIEQTLGLNLAFDHDQILRDALARARAKLEYSPIATAFCDESFTVAQLRHVYEIIWDQPLDPRNFYRKVTANNGLLVPTGTMTAGDVGRPAELYVAGTATTISPPLTRPHLA